MQRSTKLLGKIFWDNTPTGNASLPLDPTIEKYILSFLSSKDLHISAQVCRSFFESGRELRETDLPKQAEKFLTAKQIQSLGQQAKPSIYRKLLTDRHDSHVSAKKILGEVMTDINYILGTRGWLPLQNNTKKTENVFRAIVDDDITRVFNLLHADLARMLAPHLDEKNSFEDPYEVLGAQIKIQNQFQCWPLVICIPLLLPVFRLANASNCYRVAADLYFSTLLAVDVRTISQNYDYPFALNRIMNKNDHVEINLYSFQKARCLALPFTEEEAINSACFISILIFSVGKFLKVNSGTQIDFFINLIIECKEYSLEGVQTAMSFFDEMQELLLQKLIEKNDKKLAYDVLVDLELKSEIQAKFSKFLTRLFYAYEVKEKIEEIRKLADTMEQYLKTGDKELPLTDTLSAINQLLKLKTLELHEFSKTHEKRWNDLLPKKPTKKIEKEIDQGNESDSEEAPQMKGPGF